MANQLTEMFCNQCEQTARGTGCTRVGVCGKSPDAAALQDLLNHANRGLAEVALAAQSVGVDTTDAAAFIEDALFTTLTNVDFDVVTIAEKVGEAVRLRDELKLAVAAATGPSEWRGHAALQFAEGLAERIAQSAELGSPWDTTRDADIQSLQETTLYGAKGIAAYAHHARVLGKSDPAIDEFLFRALVALGDPSLGLEEWVGLALECGKANLRTMEVLDEANTGTFGQPEPTKVSLGHRKGKAILISGHDLADLKALLEQTEGRGINVYTHGEMLPSHAYPELKRYAHFAGHYGTAWQNQHREFPEFPGPVLMTTNCLMPPKESYRDKVFVAGVVGFPGLTHVDRSDFSAVIEKALAMDGFAEDTEAGEVMVGFGHNTVLSVAPAVIEAVKSGAIRHFFLVGGCDGARPGRNYYTEFVEATPSDTIVLTLACGKFRFFDRDLGEIGGLPRLMDMGQCNDAYSAIKVAAALADAFGTDVNGLPLSLVLSWYEQKAVAILLSLLYLGIKDIRLGPTLPAFITPGVLSVLVENFGIRPIGESAEADLAEMLGEPISA